MALRLAIIFLAVFTGVWAGEGLGYAEDVEFLQWSSLYYRGKEGLEDIYPVWRKNAEFVREHNSLGLSYSVEMNKFGHMVVIHQFVRLGRGCLGSCNWNESGSQCSLNCLFVYHYHSTLNNKIHRLPMHCFPDT